MKCPRKTTNKGITPTRHPENLVKNCWGLGARAGDSADTGNCCQAWKPEFGPTDWRKPTPANCPLTSIHCHGSHMPTHKHTHTQNKWKCDLKIKNCFGFVPDAEQRVFQKQLGHLKKSRGFLYITENWLQWPLTTDEGEELVPKLAQTGEIQEKETRTNRRELKGDESESWRLKEEEVLLHWWVNPVFRAFVNKWKNT